MMKVFLVDDEIAIRENLRNSFAWEENGFQLVGEAPDGEMALPMIRDLNPDILLTDIRMPFMDGMALAGKVRRTMPWVGIIILSGYDDFSYARQAIALGVREYLLKPVTAGELKDALTRIAEALHEERRERESLINLQKRLTEGNSFLKEKLLQALFAGENDRYEDEALFAQMRSLGVNLSAACYAVIDISFDLKDEKRMAGRAALSQLAEASGGSVLVCGAKHGALALTLGDNEKDTEERAYSFARSASLLPALRDAGELLLTVGETVRDAADIRRSMQSARMIRHAAGKSGSGERRILGVGETADSSRSLPETELSPLYERLQYASARDVEPILMEYASSLDPALALGYLRVGAVLTANRIVQQAGGVPRDVLDPVLVEAALHAEGESGYGAPVALLLSAVAFRDRAGRGYDASPVSRARIFLSRNFSDPNLMLQDAADHVGLSQSHFSTLFAQETGLTFTQFLTALRIGKARELLVATDKRSSEIAFEVGYNDAHYFSYLFKKTTGMTPSEYRRAQKNPTGTE